MVLVAGGVADQSKHVHVEYRGQNEDCLESRVNGHSPDESYGAIVVAWVLWLLHRVEDEESVQAEAQ